MREIFVGILLMFAFALPGFADTSVESPDWDVFTVGETESAAVITLTPEPERLHNVTGGDHATYVAATADGWEGFNTATDHRTDLPFEVGWRS